LRYFADPQTPGRWFRQVSAGYEPLNTGFHAYGHTHALFALAHAYHVTGEQAYLDAAMQTFEQLDLSRAIAGRNPDFGLRRFNVGIHAFESLLVLYRVTGDERVRRQASRLAVYLVDGFQDPGSGGFVEQLTVDGKRPGDAEVRPGHAALFAFLLSRAADVGIAPQLLPAAERAMAFIAAALPERPQTIVPLAVDLAGNTVDSRRFWWCQAEVLRGLAHFAVARGREDFGELYDRLFIKVVGAFVDPVHRGWYPRPRDYDGDKGSAWQVGYHEAMLHTELLRLERTVFRAGKEPLL
jgi:mannose/cellobiose epimerase-like protein (N-acyl-D-glucosamine 2-epimerase family)